MGQSSNGGGCLNNCSSCNSATRLSHCFLCFVRCFFLHAALQYITSLHLLHLFVTSVPSLPQLAHTDTITSLSSLVLMFCNISLTSSTLSLNNFDALSLELSELIVYLVYYRIPPPVYIVEVLVNRLLWRLVFAVLYLGAIYIKEGTSHIIFFTCIYLVVDRRRRRRYDMNILPPHYDHHLNQQLMMICNNRSNVSATRRRQLCITFAMHVRYILYLLILGILLQLDLLCNLSQSWSSYTMIDVIDRTVARIAMYHSI